MFIVRRGRAFIFLWWICPFFLDFIFMSTCLHILTITLIVSCWHTYSTQHILILLFIPISLPLLFFHLLVSFLFAKDLFPYFLLSFILLLNLFIFHIFHIREIVWYLCIFIYHKCGMALVCHWTTLGPGVNTPSLFAVCVRAHVRPRIEDRFFFEVQPVIGPVTY